MFCVVDIAIESYQMTQLIAIRSTVLSAVLQASLVTQNARIRQEEKKTEETYRCYWMKMYNRKIINKANIFPFCWS